MKKTYINPTTEIVTVEVQQMIAATGIIFSEDGASGSGSFNDEFASEPLSGCWDDLF